MQLLEELWKVPSVPQAAVQGHSLQGRCLGLKCQSGGGSRVALGPKVAVA